jgi:hypothetical protein
MVNGPLTSSCALTNEAIGMESASAVNATAVARNNLEEEFNLESNMYRS